MTHTNLFAIAPVFLPEESDVLRMQNEGVSAESLVRAHPDSPLAWALLSAHAQHQGSEIEAYAFARVGYHRGLDALRRNGWKGQGPIPWSHPGNRGVLRALYALRHTAALIGESAEVARLEEFLMSADPEAIAQMDEGA